MSEGWRRASVTPVYKRGKKENPENYRLVSLTSVSRKVVGQLILKVTSKLVEEKKIIRDPPR